MRAVVSVLKTVKLTAEQARGHGLAGWCGDALKTRQAALHGSRGLWSFRLPPVRWRRKINLQCRSSKTPDRCLAPCVPW